tara:strand:+ start:491 stop:1138 length:648 start_codon:yes stop_codon:yes gene_type:complete
MDSILSLLSHPHVVKISFLTITGFAIRQALVISGQRWANTYHHLGSYLLLPNIALIITSVIKDDIALSLGMIGALSIVRFRNPVKSPFELVMFFALLTLGIVSSVSLFLAVLLGLLVISVIFGINFADRILKKFKINIFQYSFGDGNLNFTMEINAKNEIKEIENKKNIINLFFDNEKKIYIYRLVFQSRDDLINFKNSIEKNKDITNIRADIQS